MAITEASIEGPAWTGIGIEESAGRNPLRVEPAVSNVVDKLVPGVITTTKHARMYSVHSLGWSEAEARGLDYEDARALIRRCEVIMAAVHHFHSGHRIEINSAHGEDRSHRFIRDDQLNVADAARPGTGISQYGFANVYQGACVVIGALSTDRVPRPGPRFDEDAVRGGLHGLLELADRDQVSVDEIESAAHLCLCEIAEASDGDWLRRLLTEEPETQSDRHRQITCVLLLEALREHPSPDPTRVFRERLAFETPIGSDIEGERAEVVAMWQGAALRNYSVSAWRQLWRWLASELNREPMTAEDLGSRFADDLDDVSVEYLIESLPDRRHENKLLPLEASLADETWSTMGALKTLTVGALRTGDLEGAALKTFVGTETDDLGPRWVLDLLDTNRNKKIRDLASDLAVLLVRRAKRVAFSKMYLTRSGHPFVPSRLRDRDGLLSINGEEGAGPVALRTDSLVSILSELDLLKVDTGGAVPSDRGRTFLSRHA